MKSIGNYENIMRGDPNFPIAFHYVDPQHPRYEMNLHWHIDSEIVFIEKGRLEVQLNGEFIFLNAGDVLYIASNTLHGAIPHDCVYDCIVFNEKLLFKNQPAILKEAAKFPCSLLSGNRHAIRTVSAAILYSKRMIKGDIFRILSGIYSLYASLYEAKELKINPENKSMKNINLLKTSIETIEREYNSPVTLKRLASSCGLSEGYFCAVFKSLTGRTPFEYLNLYRIEAACEMLEHKNMTVTEISLACGFNDLSYFIKTFKKYKNCTPFKYCAERSI